MQNKYILNKVKTLTKTNIICDDILVWSTSQMTPFLSSLSNLSKMLVFESSSYNLQRFWNHTKFPLGFIQVDFEGSKMVR